MIVSIEIYKDDIDSYGNEWPFILDIIIRGEDSTILAFKNISCNTLESGFKQLAEILKEEKYNEHV